MENWNIGLSSWIIQDGNYIDFKKDEVREFALEFSFTDYFQSKEKEKKHNHIKDSFYNIIGQVIFKNNEVCILDFGILAYNCEANFEQLKVGDFLSGEIYLGVDPFDYFESLFQIGEIAPLIYTWKIEKIFLETTPRIKTKDNKGKGQLIYDKSRYSVKEIEKTNAWRKEEYFADYVLSCSLISNNAKHAFSNIKDGT